MQLIDTHTHLYLPEFDKDRDDIVKRAVDSGVVKLLMPNINIHSVDLMLSVADRYIGVCYPMIGLHPTSVKDDWPLQLEELEKIGSEHKFLATGEIGIDLYWDKTYREEQLLAFRRQVVYAINSGLPVVIHSRDSSAEVFSVLEEFRGTRLKGVLHAFTGNTKDAEKAIGLGLKLGIGGIVTFKNSGLDKTLKEVGYEHIILETDSPYLTPSPHRGERNESSYIRLISKKLAEIFTISEEEVASVTFANSTGLFNI
jgi:TatD DNase family protein